MQNIAIIGAGPAGLMSAVTLLENSENKNLHIDIFEKNPSPGKKLLLSGGGRCNVTTGITDKKILETKYTRGWDFIKKSLGKFGPKKCYEWFEEHGLKLKTEADNRVFPVSDDASEVLEVFDRIFAKYRDKVSFHYAEGVTQVSVISSEENLGQGFSESRNPVFTQKDFSTLFVSETDKFWSKGQEQTEKIPPSSKGQEQKKFQVQTKKGSYSYDILVLASGGNAYAHTGSTGDGYAFARELGHTMSPLGPSLSSFLSAETWSHALSGLSFDNARISFTLSSRRDPFQNQVGENNSQNLLSKGKSDSSISLRNDKNDNLTGPILLTHFGISGPLAFMFSSRVAWEMIKKDSPKTISLAPVALLHFEDWENFLKKEFQNHPKKLIANILSEKLPRRFVDAFIYEFFSHISETFVSSISRAEREKISRFLGDGIPFTLVERRPGDEFVTAGGVSTDEIDPETMESKIQKNLYFAGEILNVDGYTGGFSLQICWSSGYVAGKVIATLIK